MIRFGIPATLLIAGLIWFAGRPEPIEPDPRSPLTAEEIRDLESGRLAHFPARLRVGTPSLPLALNREN